LTGQKGGRKKPYQPALAHCVRVAGRDALRLTAVLRVGAANRKGPKGHPVDSLRSDSDSRNGAEGHTPVCPSASHCRPSRRTARGPGNRQMMAPTDYHVTWESGAVGFRRVASDVGARCIVRSRQPLAAYIAVRTSQRLWPMRLATASTGRASPRTMIQLAVPVRVARACPQRRRNDGLLENNLDTGQRQSRAIDLNVAPLPQRGEDRDGGMTSRPARADV
jgi:hypothetical protein